MGRAFQAQATPQTKVQNLTLIWSEICKSFGKRICRLYVVGDDVHEIDTVQIIKQKLISQIY